MDSRLHDDPKRCGSRGGVFKCVFFLAVFLTVGVASVSWGQLDRLRLPGAPVLASKVSDPDVKVEVVSQYESARPGQRFGLAVVLTIADGWHLYANPRQGELGKDTEIIASSSGAVRFGTIIYPEGCAVL